MFEQYIRSKQKIYKYSLVVDEVVNVGIAVTFGVVTIGDVVTIGVVVIGVVKIAGGLRIALVSHICSRLLKKATSVM